MARLLALRLSFLGSPQGVHVYLGFGELFPGYGCFDPFRTEGHTAV